MILQFISKDFYSQWVSKRAGKGVLGPMDFENNLIFFC